MLARSFSVLAFAPLKTWILIFSGIYYASLQKRVTLYQSSFLRVPSRIPIACPSLVFLLMNIFLQIFPLKRHPSVSPGLLTEQEVPTGDFEEKEAELGL